MTIYEEAERDDWGRTEAERELFFAQRQTELSLERIKNNQYLDLKFGFKTIINEERLGWLLNLHPTSIVDPETKKQKSAVDFYFVQEDGSRFKTTFVFRPYFYISCKPDTEVEVEFYLKKKFSDILVALTILEKEDLDMSNHLIGIKRKYLKLEFLNVKDLLKVRKVLHPLVLQNQENLNLKNLYDLNKENSSSDVLAYVLDIREYDVPYHIRVAIDLSIYVGRWYEVRVGASNPSFTLRTDMEERPDLTVLAFDIETTKLPLKFPDSDIDSVMMVSYMVDGQGYLVVNRELISEDIADFEYTPTPEYEGPFTVFNEPNEKATLEKFIAHIQEIKPCIIVTFNGDYFDWPFVDKRANVNGIDIMGEVGFGPDAQDEYKSRPIIHMDAFKWVKRDSYLPQGSHGLKAVTKAKLAYDPLEINPEDMCRFASERPQALANYSVSDAVATYYLYMKYIHPFIFSLCSIIPLEPDEVLRKGSGTLCETLLMVEAFKADVIMPNKHHPPHTKFYKGKFIESETYVGGHVESLEAGVFRSNIPVDFDLDGLALDELKSGVPEALRYTLEKELEVDLSTIRNFDEAVSELRRKLDDLRVAPKRAECPLIYHLDVSAMYPNIILTNRLQPFAIVDEATCAACDFNQSGLQCQRIMDWKWRMEYIPASKPEYEHVKLHLESERFPNLDPKKASKKPQLAFYELSEAEQAKFIKMRLADLSKKIHKKSKVATVIDRTSTICMRENPFYIDTVRAFRDRRYIYKDKLKAWQSKLARATEVGERQSIKNMIVVYDSLQLAHKCILNSFYGYVMRKGARWFSMEMAGIVCLTGSAIIQKARKIVERIGKPLELDTDGIWCAFPSSFPENVVLNRINGEPDIVVSYPGAMLNVMVGNTFTNHQYHVLEDKTALRYSQRSENTIFFEVDGPYRAMILPASKEEDKHLKKRYAVYNNDGSLAELKGFELKRRGELQLTKAFQSQIFEKFLEGTTLVECYQAVGSVANQWLDILYNKGSELSDEEIFELLSETRSMSRELGDYGAQKSPTITAAKRLGEFLGSDTLRGKGLSCKFIISEKPVGLPVADRAVPVNIFLADHQLKVFYLRKWLKFPSLSDFNVRTILDWDYYIERFGGTIQRIVTIPAALQAVDNPVPRIKHPDWLHKRIRSKRAALQQRGLSSFYRVIDPDPRRPVDIEECQLPCIAAAPLREKTGLTSKGHVSNCDANLPGALDHRLPEEDSASSQSSSSVVPGTETHDLSSEAYAALYGPPPDKTADYQLYLNYLKTKWKWQVKMRAQRRGQHHLQITSGLETFFRSDDVVRQLRGNCWQIIQLLPTRTPGEFRMWAFVGASVVAVTLTVPRLFYVNCTKEDPNNRWPKVFKVLPRSLPALHLYEFAMKESAYQNMLNMKELSGFFNHPEIEGVYETNVSLEYRAIVALGCVCRVSQSADLTGTDLHLQLADFTSDHMSSSEYLKANSFEHVYIGQHGRKDCSLIGVFRSDSEQAAIIVVDPRNKKQLPSPSRLYKKLREKFLELHVGTDNIEISAPPENISFKVVYSTSETEAFDRLQHFVHDFTTTVKGRKPCFSLLDCSCSLAALLQNTPALAAMPHLFIKNNAAGGGDYNNVLQWEFLALEKLIELALHRNQWLRSQIAFSAYGHVPIGNLPFDYPVYILDVFYTRQLIRFGHVLWVSANIRPDLGGREGEDNVWLCHVAEEGYFEMTNEGFYDTVCVELELLTLAINSIVHSAQLHSAEGVSDELPFDTARNIFLEDNLRMKTVLTGYDISSACIAAFRVLKSVVHSLMNEVVLNHNELADTLCIHFYRWLSNSRSLLYDPALHQLVQTLMRKVFFQLVMEFKRLGSSIVYANFTKLIVATPKSSLSDAAAYMDFILQGIRKQEVFALLDLVPVVYWEQLWWLDKCNYAGMQTRKTTDHFSEGPCDFVSSLNIKEYLPIPLQRSFELVVGDFIYKVYESSRSEQLDHQKVGAPSSVKTRRLQDGRRSNETTRVQELLSGVGKKLFKLLPDIRKATGYEFPALPGSHLAMSDPAIEFAKFVLKILSLDAAISDEVALLRKNLFRLLGVSEFSEEAIFRNPCASYTLQEVICRFCNDCRPLDLCRDPQLVQRVWQCPQCDHPYDLELIEQTLIDTWSQKLLSYQLQDLVCTKCHQVKREHMPLLCSCSGFYTTKIHHQSFTEEMQTFHRIAKYHKFELLEEFVTWNVDLANGASF